MRLVIIGAGHNGLVAAFYLAKAGLKPIVLERRAEVGGGAVTGEIHPGFRCPALSHELLIHERIARDMELQRHGVEFLSSDVEVCALSTTSPPLVLTRDVRQSVKSLERFNQKDGAQYAAFRTSLSRIGAVLAPVFGAIPPCIDGPSAGDLWNLLKAGRAFRALGRRDEYRLLRWLTMPVADLVAEWFETDLLRATIAASGVSGAMLGPRSAGSGLVMLMREAHRLSAGGSLQVRGGPGALTRAMAAAATAAGAELRTGHGVEQILIQNDRAVGVVCGGKEIQADAIVSSADPKTTFLRLVDPIELTPDFATKIRNYRSAGTMAKINIALSSLPRFVGVDDSSVLSGRVHIGPEIDYLERAFDHAKYGELSTEPWLDVRIPSLLDPSLAPAGAHVLSIYAHYAPFNLRGSDWDAASDRLLGNTLSVLERHAPGLRSQVVATETITPAQLEREQGLWGGHVFHGELVIDQLFTMRPLLGYAQYEGPIRGLYLCGAGTHPGGFMTGLSGKLAAQRIVKSRP